MFRKFKPKNLVRIDAIQLTAEVASKVAAHFNGRQFTEETDPGKSGVEFPTFAGVKKVYLGQYIIKKADGYDIVDAKKFEDEYELAVVRTAG
jgi:hypothetical protein